MNTETAFLMLRTSDLPDGDTSTGFINAGLTSFTWNNINLRLLLGTMYEKYDLFNLCLRTVSSGVPTTAISDDKDNLNVILYCSGLPFINQTYDVIHGTVPNTVLGTYQFSGTTSANQTYQENRSITFSKSQEQCNLSIFYRIVQTDTVPAYALGSFPDVVFMFEIIGIPKEKGDKNGTRLF